MKPYTIPLIIGLSAILPLSTYAQTLVPFAIPSLLEPGTGAAASRSIIGDFNGDGIPDIITGGSREEQMSYRQGLGDGSFLDERLLNLGSPLRATGLDSIDYDGDGDLDLLVVEYDLAWPDDLVQFVLYRNDGAATFTRSVLTTSTQSSESFFAIKAGDLNGNGRVDLLYRKGASGVAYALQKNDGTFEDEVVLLDSTPTVTLERGDINGDGHLDIVIGNRAESKIMILLNDGSGVFSVADVPAGGSLFIMELTDVNNDGRLDVVTRESGTNLGYYPQLSDGTFGSHINLLPELTSINQVKVADLNSDGIADLVVTQGGARDGIMVWSAGLRDGNFADTILIDPLQGSSFGLHVTDFNGDLHPDIVSMGNLILRPSPIAVHINKTGENPMDLLPPAAFDYVIGDPIQVAIFFGFPIVVTETPRIQLQIGDDTVFANYTEGSGTSTLHFVHTVTDSDLDLDGVQLASNLIDLNGGTLTDPLGGEATLEFPHLPFEGVFVNGRGPFVESITRQDSMRSTDAATVQFQVAFAEQVTDVDASDLEVIMNAGDLVGAAIASVTGSGTTYEVTVTTGTGSGTLGLNVKRGAAIFDLDGDILAKDFVGGEVYTVRRAPIGDIDTFYMVGHADYSIQFENGEFDYILIPDTDALLPDADYPSNAVYAYAGSNAQLNLPTGNDYEFTGVAPGEPVYVLPAARTTSLPWIGFESAVERRFLAPYVPNDPRVSSSAAEYLKMQLVDMRSSSDGHFSLYQSNGNLVTGAPTAFMTTTDGIQEDDAIYLSSGSHIHRNMTFSKPGIYELDFVFSGFVDSNRNSVFDPTIDTYIESGIFTIVVGVDFPAAWREGNFGAAADSGIGAHDADPDFDGVSNLLEFAFGLNPLVSSPSPLALAPGNTLISRGVPTWVKSDTENHAVFLRRKDRIATGLVYAVQTSSDLSAWHTLITTPEVIGSNGEMEIVRVPIPAPTEGETSQFMRVQVSNP